MAIGLRKLVEDANQSVDVQSTTLTLDVLGRYICNTWDEVINAGGAPIDVVILGGGMFGGYLADQLFRKSQLRVLVLDAGPLVAATHLQNLPGIALYAPDPVDPSSAAAQQPRNLVWGMPWRGNAPFVGQAYCVGGKSLFWGGWCPPLLEDDLRQWAQSSKDVADYLRKTYPLVQRQLGIVDRNGEVTTHYIEGPLFEAIKSRVDALVQGKTISNLDSSERAPLAVQGEPPASGLFPFDKYSSVALLVEAVREAVGQPDSARRLFVVPNTRVHRLETVGNRVSRLEASSNGRRVFLNLAQNSVVVLALGTIESTRMALVSFPRSPADPAKELMGRNLMVHIRDNIKARIKRAALDPEGKLPKQLQTAALLVRGSTPAGKFHLQVTASADTGTDPDPDRLLFAMIPDMEQVNTLLNIEQADTISFWFRGVSEAAGDKITPVGAPGASWINLSPYESDEFGIPRAYVQIRPTGLLDGALHPDVGLANTMDAATEEIVKQLANGDSKQYQIVSTNRDPAGSTYHEAGTLWMGDNPDTSVTDANGRFHHVANAYCVDQSLFPTSGSVNPTLTGLVLARKVGEAIMARPAG